MVVVGMYPSGTGRTVLFCTQLVGGVNSQIWLVPCPPAVMVSKPAQDVELVVEHREASGQNHSQTTGPGSSNRADHVSDRIIAEDAIKSAGDG